MPVTDTRSGIADTVPTRESAFRREINATSSISLMVITPWKASDGVWEYNCQPIAMGRTKMRSLRNIQIADNRMSHGSHCIPSGDTVTSAARQQAMQRG